MTDEEGYYQSYKENGKWVNWWHRDMQVYKVMLGFLCSKDESNIPGFFGWSHSRSFQTEKEELLPIEKPYWIKNSSDSVGKDGIRATWIGHATCLVEVDGSIILTDPIFRYFLDSERLCVRSL